MSELQQTPFEPKWASHPGETLNNILIERRISPRDFAFKMEETPNWIHHLLEGRVRITTDVAKKLEQIVGGSAAFWLSREEQYQSDLSRLEDIQTSADAIDWLSTIPWGELVRFGWVKKAKTKKLQAKECLLFFGVESPSEWNQKYGPIEKVLAFRTTDKFVSKSPAVAAWFRRGEVEGSRIQCKDWNRDKLLAQLVQIKKLTRIKDPSVFIPRLRKICAECGVAIAIVPAPTGCRASGATKFLTDQKALILLSFRYKSDDQFWFTFFHEVGHLLLHSKEGFFVEGSGLLETDEETEADEFAVRTLFGSDFGRQTKLIKGDYRSVIRAATGYGVSPGILVGQLQYRGLIPRNSLNYLKRRYAWKDFCSIPILETR
ncbi:ImmA/IrrE family metallo-endopeptidase [Limibacillus sp. MBR-115]|jgi:plasmid maintenance system antidote protein VapI/Zn-dependent peptidase ImmA (M78 family)|uniref:ImmA/IrrE family metallo-endopeptidase n=1 Tax=Limibacillus sp. MBR-115 TaxID=3156465 RepID=UPI0033973CFB